MKYFNVHTVKPEGLQALLNTHAAKGYEIRFIRNAGPNIQVVFEQDAEKREQRRAAAARGGVTPAAEPEPVY